ncbi:TPA: hypothetical protein QEF96_000373 [Stenotrophomonas maltophilia]|nr:hypothetical protein [Stenotrophomonas sp.]HDS1221710.1 hypothetical protein [Stenotrophomonas maltophilia]
MKTDNKTLADVQPGGRVRLGDQLPPLPQEVDTVHCMVRGEQDLAEPCDNYYTAEQMRDYARAALSAQPSPGGQDAPEIEQLRALVSSILSTVSLGHQKGAYAYAGEDFGRYLAEAARDCRTILRGLSALAARQPVGQNWQHIANEWADAATNGVQWLRNIRDGASTVADALVCMESNVERIQQLKPPAQAVDLGQFRPLASYVIEQAAGTRGDMHMLACQLQTLIDRKADGHG